MKIIEMLRLSELGLSQRQIAGSAGCAKSMVCDVLKLCRDKRVNYEQAARMADKELHDLLYPEAKVKKAGPPEPDWKGVQEELARHKNLNLQFLWDAYSRSSGQVFSFKPGRRSRRMSENKHRSCSQLVFARTQW